MPVLYHRLDREAPLTRYRGIFRRQLSLSEGVALIVSGTIGAGVLGIPYAVAQVGMGLGLAYIVILGLLMTGFNLMLGQLATTSPDELQLPGLAKRFLGAGGKIAMSVIMYALLFGVLVVYIIGVGDTLAVLFGGMPILWSAVFFALGAIVIYVGIETIKTVEFFLTLGILFVVLLIAGFSVTHIAFDAIVPTNFHAFFLPYGIILFALHGTTTIPESYGTLRGKYAAFKRAIMIAGIIITAVYALFAFVVVGVTGAHTTDIATIGLGAALGRTVFVLGNVFAALAMATSFMMAGLSLRHSLEWDVKLSRHGATALVALMPFLVFLLGVRGFISAMDAIGGVLITLEMLLILLMYWRAKETGALARGKYRLHHLALIVIPLLFALVIGGVYSVSQLFF